MKHVDQTMCWWLFLLCDQPSVFEKALKWKIVGNRVIDSGPQREVDLHLVGYCP